MTRAEARLVRSVDEDVLTVHPISPRTSVGPFLVNNLRSPLPECCENHRGPTERRLPRSAAAGEVSEMGSTSRDRK